MRPYQADPAAILGCALSLYAACKHTDSSDPSLNLSDEYQGFDQLMRVIMEIAHEFEEWALTHVSFDDLTDVWPYLLEDRFGEACLEVFSPRSLTSFKPPVCFKIAAILNLHVHFSPRYPVPLNLYARNPIPKSGFEAFQIRTNLKKLDTDAVIPFEFMNEYFDNQSSSIFFALYGICSDGPVEHIADRDVYSDALNLVRAIAPGIDFPEIPVVKLFSKRSRSFVDADSEK